MARMIRMRAKVDFDARGHARRTGEVFDAGQIDAFLLAKGGYAKLVPQITPLSVAAPVPPPVPPTPAPMPKAVPVADLVIPDGETTITHETEEASPTEAREDAAEKPRRGRYRRRDLTVEAPGGDDSQA